MPVYQYDGQHFDLPEGLSNEQAMAKIEAHLGKTEAAPEVQRGRPTMSNDPRRLDAQASPVMDWIKQRGAEMTAPREAMFPRSSFEGSLLGQVAKGLSDPMAGLLQMGAEAVGNTSISDKIRQDEQAYQQRRTARGDTGLDVGRFVGNVASPINYMVPGSGGAGLLRSAATGAGMAATQPVYSEDFWSSKGIQAGVGAVLGPALEYGVKGVGALVDKMKGLSTAGQQQALQDWLVKLTGKDAEVMQALSNAPQIVAGSKPTAAEAVANLPQGVQLAAAQRDISRVPAQGAAFEAAAQAQQAARQAELAPISGTPEQQAAVEASKKAVFEQYGQPALEANDAVRAAYNDIEKTVLKNVPSLVKSAEELQAGQAANTKGIFFGSGNLPVEAVPSVVLPEQAAQKAAQLKTYQREALAETGVFPLDIKSLTNKLDTVLKSTTSDESKKVIEGVKQDLLDKADNNGLIASSDLYENIRKVMNQNINRYLTQGQQAYQGGIPQQAAATGEKVKAIIDASLDKSSSGLWSKYLSEYATHSQKLNRMAIGEELSKKLGTPLDNKERAGAFAQAVAESAGIIKKSTGQPRYEKLDQVLTPQETAAVNRVLADLQRSAKADTLASKIKTPTYETATPLEGVGLLNRAYTLTKEALGYLARGKRSEFEQKFTELALDPQAMAVFIQSGPITGQRKLVEAINKNLSPEAQRVLVQSLAIQGAAGEAGR